MNTKHTLALAIALTGAIGLSACSQQDSMSETADDVAAAQAEAGEDVAEARRDMMDARQVAREDLSKADTLVDAAEAKAEGMKSGAESAYDLAIAKAEGEMKIANERCDVLPSDQQVACDQAARAAYDSAKATAETLRASAKRTADKIDS